MTFQPAYLSLRKSWWLLTLFIWVFLPLFLAIFVLLQVPEVLTGACMLLTLGIFGAYRLYRSLYKNRSCHLLLLLFIPPIALFAFLTYNTTIAWAFPLTSYFALTTALIGFTLISLMALWSALTCYLVFQHRKQKQSNLLLK